MERATRGHMGACYNLQTLTYNQGCIKWA